MFNRLCQRFYKTFHAKRSAPKLVNHLPGTAGGEILLDNGCRFIDLQANARTPLPEALPALPSRGGAYIDDLKLEEIRELRRGDPERWTITQLAKKCGASRSFIIAKVLTEGERARCQAEIKEALGAKSIKQQKGWIIRHKIRADREALW